MGRVHPREPRLFARLTGDADIPPLGERLWPDTGVAQPKQEPAAAYRDCFTGKLVEPRPTPDGPRLAAADLFSDFPLALLVAER